MLRSQLPYFCLNRWSDVAVEIRFAPVGGRELGVASRFDPELALRVDPWRPLSGVQCMSNGGRIRRACFGTFFSENQRWRMGMEHSVGERYPFG
jgi:hypothetical protein